MVGDAYRLVGDLQKEAMNDASRVRAAISAQAQADAFVSGLLPALWGTWRK